MTIDVLPHGSYALETWVQPPPAPSRGQTLTLASALTDEPMAGSVGVHAAHSAAVAGLHAGVVAADDRPFTFTP